MTDKITIEMSRSQAKALHMMGLKGAQIMKAEQNIVSQIFPDGLPPEAEATSHIVSHSIAGVAALEVALGQTDSSAVKEIVEMSEGLPTTDECMEVIEKAVAELSENTGEEEAENESA